MTSTLGIFCLEISRKLDPKWAQTMHPWSNLSKSQIQQSNKLRWNRTGQYEDSSQKPLCKLFWPLRLETNHISAFRIFRTTKVVELGVGAKVLVGQQAPKKFSSRRLWCFNLDDAIRHWWNSSGSFSNTSAAGFGVEKHIQHTEYLIHDYTFSITHLAGKYIQTHLLSGAPIVTCNGCDKEK